MAPIVVPGDLSTYAVTSTISGGMTLLPYYQPCQSICTAVSYAGTTCGGILEMQGASLGCTSNDPTNTVKVYSSAATCNALTSTYGKQLVASPTEPYLGTQCAGITKNVYVPPTSMVDLTGTLAPLLPSYVIQNINEQYLKSVFDAVPRLLKEDCLTDLRKALCPLKHLNGQPLSELKAYFGMVYMPQYPDQQLCLNFRSSCKWLIEQVPALNALNCETAATVSGITIKAFPTEKQTLMTVLGVPLKTDPNKLSDMDEGFAVPSECPYGFAVPKDPTLKKTVIFNSAFACAAKCPLQVYPDSTFVTLYRVAASNYFFALSFILIAVVHIVVTKSSKSNVFIRTLVICEAVALVCAAIHFSNNKSWHEGGPRTATCSSETSWYATEDALKNSDIGNGARLCIASAFLTRIYDFIGLLCIICIFFEVWCRVVLGLKNIIKARMYFVSFWAVIIVGSMIALMSQETSSFNTSLGFGGVCGASSGNKLFDDIVVKYLLAYTVAFILIVLSVWSGIKCAMISWKTRDRAEKSPLKKLWKSYKVIFTFSILMLILFPVQCLFYVYYLGTLRAPEASAGTKEWIECLLKTFTSLNADPSGGIQACGEVPKNSLTLTELLGSSYFTFTIQLVAAVATMNSDTSAFWWSLLPIWIQESMLCSICRSNQFKILPSDKTSIGNSSQSMHNDQSSAEDEDDEEDAEVQLKITKRIAVGPVNSIEAQQMGDKAAKIAAGLYLSLDKDSMEKNDAQCAEMEHTPTLTTPPSSECGSPDVSARLSPKMKDNSLSAVDAESKESV